MAPMLDAFVAALQIGLLGFLAWGAWLAIRSQLPEKRASALFWTTSLPHV